MPAAISITLFGGPADGRTMASPADASYVDFHVAVGRAIFGADARPSTITHRYWIEKSTSGTHGIGLHAGPVAYKADSSDGLPQDA